MNNRATPSDNKSSTASGVEVLIKRLRQEGVDKGRQEAERIVTDAQHHAQWLVDQAHEQAERVLQEARAEAGRLHRSGEEALQIAARDTILHMKTVLSQRFAVEVKRLVGEPLRDEDFLRRLILEIAGRTRDEVGLNTAKRMEVLLPKDVVGLEELRRHPEELKEGTLSHFVLTVAQKLLREGVSFGRGEDNHTGIRLQLTDHDLEVELTDEAVATLLLEHLQPRFRALLEGIVK
jgi:V/A-type H+/Na+-transporting ATPase subunit E